MQKDFNLEAILTVTTGNALTDDFCDVFELAKFVFDDESINTSGIQVLKQPLRQHLLTIHPELDEVGRVPTLFLDSWLRLQKEKYGAMLSVPQIGEQLEKDVKVNIKKPKTNRVICN